MKAELKTENTELMDRFQAIAEKIQAQRSHDQPTIKKVVLNKKDLQEREEKILKEAVRINRQRLKKGQPSLEIVSLFYKGQEYTNKANERKIAQSDGFRYIVTSKKTGKPVLDETGKPKVGTMRV